MRDTTWVDHCLFQLDQGLRTLFAEISPTDRPDPASMLPAADLSDAERQHVVGLMRVNHAGEVSAQALYQGQALTADLPAVREAMAVAAAEEQDHLRWCENRLTALGAKPSYLNPVWYLGSFAIGAMAGWMGDAWSLGFVAETERQVVAHLEAHLQAMPPAEQQSRAVLAQMQADEQHHATVAVEAGAMHLPWPVPQCMALSSSVMTTVAYYF